MLLGSNFLRDLRSRGRESNVLPRKAAAGAERGSLEPGHASLPGLAGRQLAAGTWRPVPAHKSLVVALLDTTALRGQLCRAALPQDRERRGAEHASTQTCRAASDLRGKRRAGVVTMICEPGFGLWLMRRAKDQRPGRPQPRP